MPVQNGRNCYPEIPYFFPSSVSDASPGPDEAPDTGAAEVASAAPCVKESERVRSLRAQLRAELERTAAAAKPAVIPAASLAAIPSGIPSGIPSVRAGRRVAD